MSRNGSGTYSLPAGNPVTTGTTISSTWANNTLSDIATALTNSIAKDGQTTPTANLPMGNFKLTGLASGTAKTDSANLGQTQDGVTTHLGSVSGVDTITATANPTLTAYTNGNKFSFVSAGANTGAVTLNVDGLGAKSITKNGTTALVAGDIPSGAAVIVVYDGTRFQLQAPAVVTSATNATNLTGSGTISSTTTATTQAQNTNNTTVATTAYVDTINVPVRQTVLSGPVDSSGFSAFGGSTGSAIVTASGTLKATAAAGGSVNYTGSITNPSWTGLSTNGTMYLYLDITSAGVVTTGSTTLAPIYQWGGTYSTTNNQNTFNIQEMTMKVGNGSTSSQVYRVFVGQVTVAGNVTTAIVWYALMARYTAAWVATLPAAGSGASFNHNIGFADSNAILELECTTIDANYAVGDRITNINGNSSGVAIPITIATTSLTSQFIFPATANALAQNKTTGANTNLTLASWKYRMRVQRSW